MKFVALVLLLALTRVGFGQINDNFTAAAPLSGSSGSASTTSGNATKQPSEPNHAGNPGGHSLWYRWTAPSATPVTFETIGSSFDTLLAIYTGSTLSNLVEVASNNDIFGSNTCSRARFIPVGGVIYWIAVDGFNAASGDVYLRWLQRTGLPDLVVWGPSLSPFISIESFSTSSCAVVEGLLQPGTRKLLRFATETRNAGTADMVLGNPAANPIFEWSACHGHYHFHDYVAHRLKTGATVVASGGKVGHCLLDSIRWDPAANSSSVYGCGNQGIQKGWGDVYRSSLDGQWIDITGVPAGNYSLELELNRDRTLEESNYSNNVTQVAFSIPDATKPQVSSFSPTNGTVGVSPAIIATAIIVDGTTAVATNSVQFFYDGVLVAPTITKNAGLTTVTYSRPGLLEPSSSHTNKLIFADNGATVTWQTNIAAFTVGAWSNKYLPPPLYLETFDAVAEGALPSGWSVTNYTDTDVAGYDLNNAHSDAFKNWVIISLARLTTQFPADRRTPGTLNVVNGVVLDGLIQGQFIYAASDPRSGDQVQYLFSPDYALTSQSNIWVSFHSIHTQNQDAIAALEYSINGGTNWLPVIYMLDGADIQSTGGSIDAVKTLTNRYSDVAIYFDPGSGQPAGGYYGAFISAPITQALAPFISGRVNDDQAESKRVELFRLPAADNQARVRFRFAQAGTFSWYWGIDDFGIYSIPAPQVPRFARIHREGENVSLQWNGEIVSRLQKRTGLAPTLWQDVPGTLGLSNFTEPISPGETYYRLIVAAPSQ